MAKTAILLSAYNGGKYIEDQIKSIYQQTDQDFTLIIRDDGSVGEEVKKLEDLQSKYGFELIQGKNLGFLKSFFELLRQAEGYQYYSFADQDDIWLPGKLEAGVKYLESCEDEKKPRFYHCAYDLVDDQMKKVGKFYFSEEGYDFRRTITENHYSGFAMVINQALRKKMLQGDPEKIGYHDWWAGMIVHAMGEVYYDSKVYAYHRSHGDNVTTFNMKTRWKWLRKTLREESEIHKRAVEFKRCFYQELRGKDKNYINLFSGETYSFKNAMKKVCSPKRWRPVLSSELVMRFLMLIGKI